MLCRLLAPLDPLLEQALDGAQRRRCALLLGWDGTSCMLPLLLLWHCRFCGAPWWHVVPRQTAGLSCSLLLLF